MRRLIPTMDRHALSLWLARAVAAGLFLFALDALARPGGGGNYTGRGSGGFGGGGGGGGGGDGLGMLIYLVFAYPQIGVPVLVVVAIFAVVKRARNPDRTTARAVARLERAPASPSVDLTPLQSRDPHFKETAFLLSVKKLVFELQEAWCRGNMDPVRPLLSDGLMRRFETQLAIMKTQGIQNAMADQQVLGAHIRGVEHDAYFDTLHVAVTASVRDVEVAGSLTFDEALARAKKAPREEYTEVWSFLRSPGAETLASGGAMEGRCPNCGNELMLGQTTRCDHCEALVNSGEYDWVLSEITQNEEWHMGSKRAVPGLLELGNLDPKFNRQAAEDRASYLFWRWIEAKVLGTAAPLAKIAAPELHKVMVDAAKGGQSALYKIAVGGADLLACEPGLGKETDEGRDRIHVKILWSSARSQKGECAHQAHVLTMSRQNGSKSSGGLSHARCPECHGPLTENDSPTCDYCGTDLSLGKSEWVLEEVRFPEEVHLQTFAVPMGSETTSKQDWSALDMGSTRERTLLLMRMAAVVVADGVVTKEEQKLLKRMSKRWNIPLEAVEPILKGGHDANTALTMQPSNPRAFLSGLVQAALVDGRVDKKEAKLLVDIGKNLGLPEQEVRSMWR